MGRGYLAALLLLTLGFVPGVPALADNGANPGYERQLQQLQGNIKRLQEQLSKVKSERDKLQAELQTAETAIARLHGEIAALDRDIASGQQRLAELGQRREQLLAERLAQQQTIAAQVEAAYRLGRQSQLKLWLNLEDPGQWQRLGRYHQHLVEARAERIDRYLATVRDIDRISPAIEQQTRALQDNRTQLLQRRQQLDARQQQRNATLARLQRDISGKGSQLQALQQDRQRLQQLLEEMASAIADLAMPGSDEPFGQRRGKLALPVDGKLLQRFGQPRVAGKLNWEGVLIGARAGSPVQAVHHGRVVFSDYLRGHGLLLILDHGDGYLTLYAHNQALLKDTGDWVSAGEAIARVGNTGGRAEAAVYFEIRHQGRPVNPAKWCRS